MTRQLEPQAAKRWQPLPAACTVPTTCARRHLQETGCEVAAARSRRRGGGCPVRRALRRCPLQGAMVRPCASPATRTAAQAPSAAKARGAAASRRWRPAWGAALRLRARRDERRDAQSGLAEPVRGWPLAASLEAVELMSLVAYALASMHAKRRPAASSCADRSTAYRPARARSARGPLEQGLLNLLSNALKYKRTGGRVLVQPEPGAKRWRLVVEDNGHGQSAGLRALVSVPFERLGAASSGIECTVMGLALLWCPVDLMQGHIGVNSEPVCGSRRGSVSGRASPTRRTPPSAPSAATARCTAASRRSGPA
jgi:hypothetical protein